MVIETLRTFCFIGPCLKLLENYLNKESEPFEMDYLSLMRGLYKVVYVRGQFSDP